MWVYNRQKAYEEEIQRIRKARELKTREKKRSRYHMQRLSAQVRYASLDRLGSGGGAREHFDARILSTDLGQNHIRLFTGRPLQQHSRVAITIGSERASFYIRARVHWCYETLSESQPRQREKFKYRSELVLEYSSEQERHLVQSHLRRLYREHTLGFESPRAGNS